MFFFFKDWEQVKEFQIEKNEMFHFIIENAKKTYVSIRALVI